MIRHHLFKHLIVVVCTLAYAQSIGAQGINRDPTKVSVVFRLPGSENVVVKKDIPYKSVGDLELRLDAYYPPSLKKDERLPAVIFVNGVGNNAIFPKFKDWGQYTNWARLVAASGFVAINYDSRGSEAEADAV